MRIKETQSIIPGGLGRHTSRTRVVEVPDGPLPDGAIETTEEPHDWILEDAPIQLPEGNQ